MAARPLFIVLEGIDGSGTTTQAERLAEHLRGRGRRVHVTREPSTGPVGVLLRQILLGGHCRADGAPISGDTMALLFAADRQDHLFREIEPALADGQDVISDRYQWSSLAYQAAESDQAWVASLARGLRGPDLTLLIDVPVQVAAARRARAQRADERYDADPIQQRVAAQYRRLAAADARALVVDGRAPVEDVTCALAAAVAALIDEPELARAPESAKESPEP